MKVVAGIKDSKVNVDFHSTFKGEAVKRQWSIPFVNDGNGINTIRITEEALQDMVAFINNPPEDT